MSPVAIVTASDSGIGQESAKELAENGFDLGITYRTDEAGAQETLEAGRTRRRLSGPLRRRVRCVSTSPHRVAPSRPSRVEAR